MRLWPAHEIEYLLRYGIVLFWHNIVYLDVFMAMVSPSDQRVSLKFENYIYL